jgi:hypothetical protein
VFRWRQVETSQHPQPPTGIKFGQRQQRAVVGERRTASGLGRGGIKLNRLPL